MTAALAAAGYRADLDALRRRRREHEAMADPSSPAATAEVLTLRHREAVLAGGRPEELLALSDEVEDALARFAGWPDLHLLRAGLALAVHRPDQARTAIDAVPGLADLAPGRVVMADVAQFAGDYGAAREGYLRAACEDPLWDTSARLAALAAATGDVGEAEARYVEAEDDLTVKQLRAFAWVRVQRGDLALSLGDLEVAARRYAEADRAYPGWWYVAARRARLDVTAGRPDDAIAAYREVLAEVDRPEFREGLGTALAAAGRTDEAATCHAAALATYTASAERGEVHYLHHLAEFCADVVPDPPAAVAWAERDVRIRRNGTTLSLLGWCLYRAGRTGEARAAVDEALALGAGDARLLERDRTIGQEGGRHA